MKKNGLSLSLKIIIGVIIAAIIGVVSIAAVKKVRVNNTKNKIAESIAYIQNNFSCLDSTQTRCVNPGVVEIVNTARYSAKEACDYLENMKSEKDYRKLIRKRDPVLEKNDYRDYVDKMPILMATVYMGADRENDFMYQEAIFQVLKQYVRVGEYITNTTVIPWPLISLYDYLQQKKYRDEKSTQLLTEGYNILLIDAKEGESVKSIRKAMRIRNKRDNDIDILHFDESVLDFIIRYDKLLMNYCQQPCEQQKDK